ncbi:MAG: molybdopterin-dependent oxidoreductase [Chloroflexota bacterium]
MSHNHELTHTPDWVHRHTHDPNPAPPSLDPTLALHTHIQESIAISIDDLKQLPAISLSDCYIVSTGHGTSGPFVFTGVLLGILLEAYLDLTLAELLVQGSYVDVISADDFGARVQVTELAVGQPPIVLAYTLGGVDMTREQGLVRLIVPSETDDALRQVKWIERIVVYLK